MLKGVLSIKNMKCWKKGILVTKFCVVRIRAKKEYETINIFFTLSLIDFNQIIIININY